MAAFFIFGSPTTLERLPSINEFAPANKGSMRV
jgi:hypothetical protein